MKNKMSAKFNLTEVTTRPKHIPPSWKSQGLCSSKLVGGCGSIKSLEVPLPSLGCGPHLQGLSQQLWSRQQGRERKEDRAKGIVQQTLKVGSCRWPQATSSYILSAKLWFVITTSYGRLANVFFLLCSSVLRYNLQPPKKRRVCIRDSCCDRWLQGVVWSLLPSFHSFALSWAPGHEARGGGRLCLPLSHGNHWGKEQEQKASRKIEYFSILSIKLLSNENIIQEAAIRQVLEHKRGKIKEEKTIKYIENRDHVFLHNCILVA